MTMEATIALSRWIGLNIIALGSLIIAGISLVMAGISLWYSIFRKCKIEVFVGDKIGIVISSGSGLDAENTKIHLNCCFINNSSKAGVIEKISIKLNCPNSVIHEFEWNEFYKPIKNIGVDADSLPLPIPVSANSSINKGIQFQLPIYTTRKGNTFIARNDIDWVKGKYELLVMGWYNKTNIQDKPNMKKTLFFCLNAEDVSAITSGSTSQQATVKYIDISNR